MSVPFDEEEPVGQLLATLDRLAGACCHDCGAALCGHGVLFNVILGLQDASRCLACLARGLGRERGDLCAQLEDHVHGRDCYRRAWREASRREGLTADSHPPCLGPVANSPEEACLPASAVAEAGTPEGAVAVWDAGDMACGPLVLALRGRLNSLRPGDVLEVTARDPAASEDLPAWCRLTGHRLLQARHPLYRIQRKE